MNFRYAALMLLMTLVLAGIQPLAAQDAPADFPVTVVDGEGVELTFAQPVERVVCLDNSCVEELAFLGVMPAAVGEFFNYNILIDPTNFGDAARAIPQIPADGDGNPDFEALAEFAPELVVGWSELRPALEGIAPVYTRHYESESLDTFVTDVRHLAALLGMSAEAETKIQAAFDRINAYSRLSPKDKSLFITQISGGRAVFWSYPTSTFNVCAMINLVAQCAYPDSTEGHQISLEALLSINPDVIIIGENDFQNRAIEQIVDGFDEAEPLWTELKAFQNDDIYIIPRTRVYGFTIKSVVTMLDTLMPLLYPDVFPEALTDAQVQEALSRDTGSTKSALSMVDGAGNTLTFDAVPQRIACLYSRCVELLAALEVVPVGMMISHEAMAKDPAYFPQPNDISLMDWDGDFPNMEQLAALAPDLVLGWDELRAPLEGIAPVYSVVNEQDSYRQSHDEIRAFAKLLGREDIAEANITAALKRLAAYQKLSPRNVSVMNVFFYNDTNYYRDGDSGTCNLLKEVAICDWADPANAATWSVGVNDEGLLLLDPDVMVVSAFGFEGMTEAEIRAKLAERPLWGELKAIQTGRVYVEPGTINLDGMGTVSMNQMLDFFMPRLYPEVFPAPLTDDQVQEILAGA